MAGPIVIDVSQVAALARNLTAAGPAIHAAVAPVMAKAGLEMKRKGKAEASAIQGGRVAAAWSYDTTNHAGDITVEAGPREGGAGSLAFFYYGNSKIGPRLPDPVHIVEEEATVTARFLETAATRAIRALG